MEALLKAIHAIAATQGAIRIMEVNPRYHYDAARMEDAGGNGLEFVSRVIKPGLEVALNRGTDSERFVPAVRALIETSE